MGLAYPCDRDTVTVLASTDAGAAAPIATPLLAPRPGICGGNAKGANDLPLRPISWSKAGLRVLLGGTEIGPVSNEPPPRGSARSPNGEHAVIATELGVLLLHKDKAELWRTENPTIKRLQECVIDDTAQHVACVDRARAVLLALAPAAAPTAPLNSVAPPPNPAPSPASPTGLPK
jgi:hypothetical protein